MAKIHSLIQEKIIITIGRIPINQVNSVKVLGELFHELKRSRDSMYSSIVSASMIMIVKSSIDAKAFSSLYSDAVLE